MSICRNICANGLLLGRRPRAISSSKSTSIRRAFCSFEPTLRGAKRRSNPWFRAWKDGLLRFAGHDGKGDPTKKACRHLRRQAFVAAESSATVYATQRLLIWWTGKRRVRRARLRDDLGGDVADAGAGQADGAGSARGQVKHAALDEGTTVIDRDDDALATMGHPELGAERQRAVGRGQGVLVEALSGGGLAAGFIAVKRSLSREAVPGARADRGIGVHPVALGLVGMSVVGMVAVMPGFGGGFGDAATDQESCGDQGESRTRPG